MSSSPKNINEWATHLDIVARHCVLLYCRNVAFYDVCLFYGVVYSVGVYSPTTIPSFLLTFFLSMIVQSTTDHSTDSPLSKQLERACSETSDAHRSHETCLLRNINGTIFRIIRRDFRPLPTSERSFVINQ